MGRRGALRIYSIVRNFLFSSINKEFLIFLFFLCLSGAFWLLMTLNETYEKEIMVPVCLAGVPEGVVVTSETDDTIRVSVRDKGYFLLAYLYGNNIRPVNIDYRTFVRNSEKGTVTAAEMQKLIYPQLYSSSRIVSVKPEKYEFFYTKGQNKLVPVSVRGKILPEKSYYIAKISVLPEKVRVYASERVLDSIKNAYTELLNISNLADTVSRNIDLRKIRGAKFVPATVAVTIYPDVLTEETVEVPITAVNMPDGKILRTFPPRVSVLFTAGASMFRNIRPEQFKVVADYNDILAHPSEKCSIYLKQYPSGVRNAVLEVEQVDYLIEGQ